MAGIHLGTHKIKSTGKTVVFNLITGMIVFQSLFDTSWRDTGLNPSGTIAECKAQAKQWAAEN